jgi:hypothetical protein
MAKTWENDNRAIVQACYRVYSVFVAAARKYPIARMPRALATQLALCILNIFIPKNRYGINLLASNPFLLIRGV